MERNGIKRISFVITDISSGGAERVMSLLANRFCEIGIETQIIAIKSSNIVYPLDKRIKYVYIGNKDSKVANIFHRLKSIRKKAKDSDAVISFLWHCNLYTLLANLFTRQKIIISERSDPNKEMRGKYRYFKWFRNLVYQRADKIVFQTKDAMDCYHGRLKRKGTVISNPITPDLPEIYTSERDNILYAAGRLTEQKNMEMMIRAFQKIHQVLPEYNLVIYGEGEERQKLERLILDFGLKGIVKLPGFTRNLAESIKKGKLYLSSSNYEGVSNSMLEAMAMGLPVVVTDCPVGGAKQFVKPYVNGILVPTNEVGTFVDAIVYILKNNDIRLNMSREAIQIRKNLSIDKIGKAWLDLIY